MSEESRSLESYWDEYSQPLFMADGSNPRIPYNIVSNEPIKATIRELAARYLPMCEEKFKLLHEKRRWERQFISGENRDDDAIDAGLAAVEVKIKEFDANLVRANAAALKSILDSEGFEKLRGGGDLMIKVLTWL